MKLTNREEFYKYLNKTGAKYTINSNPSEEQLEYIETMTRLQINDKKV